MPARLTPATSPRGQPFSRHLAWLIFFSVFPILCVLGYTVFAASKADTQRSEAEAGQLAESIAGSMDIEWAKLQASLMVLADAPELQQGDLVVFAPEARDFVRRTGSELTLLDINGQPLLNTGPVTGHAPPLTRNWAAVAAALQSGEPQIVDAYREAQDGEMRVAVYVPVSIAGSRKLALAAALPLAALRSQIRGGPLPHTWQAELVDGRGTRLWHSQDTRIPGQPATSSPHDEFESRGAGRHERQTPDGVVVVDFHRRMAITDWTVVVSVPKTALQAPFVRSLTLLTAAGALALALGVAFASRISRRLEDAVNLLTSQAHRLGEGAEPSLPTVGILEFQELAQAIVDAGRERRSAESRARDAVRSLGFALDSARAARFSYDFHTQRAEWSDNAWQLLGISPEKAAESANWESALHPEDKTLWWDALREAVRTRKEDFWQTYRIVHPEMGIRWLSARSRISYSDTGEALRVDGINVDVSDLKALTIDLYEKEERLRLFIEGAPTGIAMFDRNMCYLAVSRHYIEEWRLDDDIIGRYHYDVFPDTPARWREIHQRCLGGETMSCDEDAFPRSDGSEGWLRWDIRPWFGHDGEVGGIIMFSENITHRKAAEEGLKRAKKEAETANNAKSRFLAAASHDLRQPLSALTLYIDVLAQQKPPGSERLLGNMQGCVASLSELLTNLLDLSKLEAGVVHPEPRDFPLADIFANLASVHGPEAQQKGLSLRCAPTRLSGHTDPVLFQRMLGNLVANAVRYTECGGILIGCRRRQGRLWVEVRDSGIGIPADKTEEIFEEFKQLGNDERSRSKGSGLGLTIVARTASLLGLRIRVSSQLGRGSVFAIEVPQGKANAARAVEQAPQAALRVALVEDDVLLLGALEQSLQEAGHAVVPASSSSELLEHLGEDAPDIVISDYRLARGETGFDVVNAVRQRFGAAIPALLITGDTDPKLMRDMAARDVRVFHKPMSLEALKRAVGELGAKA